MNGFWGGEDIPGADSLGAKLFGDVFAGLSLVRLISMGGLSGRAGLAHLLTVDQPRHRRVSLSRGIADIDCLLAFIDAF
jgi:hypothetical protein